MRGTDNKQTSMFSYVSRHSPAIMIGGSDWRVSQDDRIPADHPMRKLKEMIDPMLVAMSRQFARMYSDVGRPSIPPEYLLRASLLQILYTIRSERLLMEQLDYNLLFRWFVGLSMDDEVWDHSVFSKNRDRLLRADIATKFLAQVLALAREHDLLSDEHFSVDGTRHSDWRGTLIEAWASQKSFVQKETPTDSSVGTQTADPGDGDDPGNPTVDFRGEKRTNATHQSTTDPEARLYKKGKGKESKLSFMGHVVIDNRHGLVVSTCYSQATGTAECQAAVNMIDAIKRKQRTKGRRTLGADKAYDTNDFVEQMRRRKVTPHVAQNTERRGGSAIDERTTRHVGYQISQWKRKVVEEVFGWLKTIGLMRKTRHKGINRGGWIFTFTNAVYNLVRIRNITTVPAG